MRIFGRFSPLPLLPLLALVLSASAARADHLTGDGTLGHYEGSMTYTPLGAAGGDLTVELTNTSPAANGGYLTAFVLNNPGDLITGATLTASPNTFGLLGAPAFDDGVNGAPFGHFDFGAGTGGAFEGGGKPQGGLAVGETGTFTFHLAGAGVGSLTLDDFLTELSEGNGAGRGHQFFVGRFRGFEDGGSDKVPATHHQPEPGTLTLCGVGLLSLAVCGWRLRKRALLHA